MEINQKLIFKETIEELIKLSEKYRDLVWYARKPSISDVDEEYKNLPEEMREVVKKCIQDVQTRFPEEIKDLNSDRSNWEHGFNSGCLSSFRFILTAIHEGLDIANEEFPKLDT